MDAAGPGEEPRAKRRWIPRNVKITLLVLLIFFVVEVILPPELHSARKEFHQLDHLNFLWLILGAAARAGLPGRLRRAHPHRALPRGAEPLPALPDQHVGPGHQPRPPGWHRARDGRQLPPPDRVRGAGEHRRLRAGHPGHRLGRRPQRDLLAGPAHLDPAERLQPLLRLRRHPRRAAPLDLRRPGRCSSPGARSRPTASSTGWRPTSPSSSPRR